MFAADQGLSVLGSALDLNGCTPTCGSVMVEGGSIIDSSGGNGSLTSSGFALDDAVIKAQIFDLTAPTRSAGRWISI